MLNDYIKFTPSSFVFAILCFFYCTGDYLPTPRYIILEKPTFTGVVKNPILSLCSFTFSIRSSSFLPIQARSKIVESYFLISDL